MPHPDDMASIDTVAAWVAHEINNPLGTVQGNIEFALDLLSRGAVDLEGMLRVREALDDALQGCSHVRLVLRDLRTSSRHEDGGASTVDLRQVVESALRMARAAIGQRARVVKDLRSVPRVAGSATRLRQVFLNLLVNAAEAIPDGGPDRHAIRVATATDAEGQALVTVSDTGAGIAPGMRERIFEPFFTTKPRGQGTGLGLAISRDIVTSLGGTLMVSSEEGNGSEFRVMLPPSR
jgi:signal transduction histidine kinase